MMTNPYTKFFGNSEIILASVKNISSSKSFEKGETLLSVKQGDDRIFFLLKGRVRVFVPSAEGHEIWLDEFGPGEIFGEMAAIGGFKRTSNIVAETDVNVAIFESKEFLKLMKHHSSIGIELSKVLVNRIRKTTRRMFELSVLSAPGRIYSELLRVSSSIGPNENERKIIKPLPNLTEIAKHVNSTRETVSRAINDLEKRGLVVREGDTLYIITPRKLSGMIS